MPIVEGATDAGRGGAQLRDGELTQRSVSSIGDRREASAVRRVPSDRDRVVFDVFRVEPDRCLLLQPLHRR